MSVFLSLADAVIAALQQAPAAAGGRIVRGRDIPLPIEHDSGVAVNLLRSRGEAVGLYGPARQWQTDVGVQLSARAAAGGDAEAAIDPLLMAAYERLAGLAPPAGSGVHSVTLDPSITWEVDEGDRPVVTATLVVSINHLTTTATLE